LLHGKPVALLPRIAANSASSGSACTRAGQRRCRIASAEFAPAFARICIGVLTAIGAHVRIEDVSGVQNSCHSVPHARSGEYARRAISIQSQFNRRQPNGKDKFFRSDYVGNVLFGLHSKSIRIIDGCPSKNDERGSSALIIR